MHYNCLIILVGTSGQQIKVLGTPGQIIKSQPSSMLAAQNQGMTGIAALAAAAAATSKITTSGAQTITSSSGQAIKVIQQGPHGQLITPQGVRVTPVSSTGVQLSSSPQTALIGGQTVRLAAPGAGGTLLKTATGATISSQGGKQIILQKQGLGGIGTAGQPQIVTLVKTPSGMQVSYFNNSTVLDGDRIISH